ncbi:MAG: rane protein involved in aromatic hydrocarbon degradation [Bacteroidetes bacterium]|nr:rane protein involved in aromatic hydrocarbon degradation [Bacteroidota bacterium]
MKLTSKMRRVWFLIAVTVGISQQYASAQFIEDALRLGNQGIGVGARSLGMGNAYTGVASDFSALYWNPAGLAQARYGEFSFGLSYLNNKDKSAFNGNADEAGQYTSSATNLNTLGLVLPVPVRRGSLVFAFGYNRQSNFTSGMGFEGFNPVSSIIQTWAPNGEKYPEEITLAEELELADADTVTGTFISPINGNVTQMGEAIEKGGLNNWSLGGGVDLAKNLSVGVTLTYVAGSYRYDRNYQETAAQGTYAPPYDMKALVTDEFIDGDIDGFNAKFGLLYRLPDWFRLGLAVKTPTSFSVKESFGTSATSYFWTLDPQGYSSYGPIDEPGTGEYTVVTPWVFSAGASLMLWHLVISGDVDYTDWTQLEFTESNSDLDIQGLNREIRNTFRPAMNLRGGAEIEPFDLGVRFRAGFTYNQSPYKDDPKTFDQKYLTAGLGLELGEATMLDAGYAYGWWDTYRVNYDQTSRVDEKIKTNTFILTLTHRF